MGWGLVCRYEPEGARGLEQRESRGQGGSVLGRDGRRTGVAGLTQTRAAATAVSTPSIGLSKPN